MNILLDSLPTSLMVKGRKIKINSDFRSCLPIIMAFEDNELTQEEKVTILIRNLFPVTPRVIGEDLLREAFVFLNCGEPAENIPTTRRIYSFDRDANFVYAAFRQTHGIDLRVVNLHWWEFNALFMDLGQDTTFCQLISLRKRIADGTALPEEQKLASAHPELFELEEPDFLTIEEKEAFDTFQKLLEASDPHGSS